LEPDRLVLIALGADASLTHETEHVTDCPTCRAQLEDLQVVAALSAETQEVRDLPPPPERIWTAVAAAVEEPAVPRRRFPRTVVVALAAAIVAAVATLGVTRLLDRAPSTSVAARATLDRFGAAPAGAHGDARIVGGSELWLHVSGMPLQPGFYEVWLLDPDSGRMIAVGTMGADPEATMPLPANVNLRVYRTIDVSAEEYDGNPAHSGRSMLRGSLTN
jgi:hypothetical protein